MTRSTPSRGTVPHLTADDPATPETLGGFTIPGDHDAKGWHDLAEKRAAAEGIPWPFDPSGTEQAELFPPERGADKSVRDPN